ncbi:hypothetical protein Q3C01_43010 [Bradyrhizobium sp. UFLA05-109]
MSDLLQYQNDTRLDIMREIHCCDGHVRRGRCAIEQRQHAEHQQQQQCRRQRQPAPEPLVEAAREIGSKRNFAR